MKKYIVLLIKSAIVLGIFYYLSQEIDFFAIIKVIASANLFYYSAAFAIVVVNWCLQAYQTQIMLKCQGMFFSIYEIFRINLESSFYTLFVPGGFGASNAKWYKLSRPEGKKAQSFTIIVVMRLLSIITMIAVGLVALLLKNPFNYPHINVIVICILLLLVFLQLVIFNKMISAIVENYILSKLKRLIPGPLKEKIVKIQNSFYVFQELSSYNLFLILFIPICLHLLVTFSFFLISISVRMDVSIWVMMWITSVVLLIQIAPISISGLGIREGTLFFLLGKYNIPGSDALAFSFLVFSVSVLVALIGGVIEVRNFFSRGKTPKFSPT